MPTDHNDAAATITPSTARKLVEGASPRRLRLLELFARRQLLRFEELIEELDTTQNGLNALLGHLTREFQEIQGEAGFHIYLPRLQGWAIGHISGVNLRRALKESERERQRRLEFQG